MCLNQYRQASSLYNSTAHEISTAHKTKMLKTNTGFLALNLSGAVCILLINVEMPYPVLNVKHSSIVGILTFISCINCMLS